ncbi:MAG TPA: DUF6518 family protein [Acidothermaceae bacterium]|jgi:hypothetical protein|nr:DUF6518 family protein [Acidothermaceae bacterium]
MARSVTTRLGVVLLSALAFGVLAAWAKGQNTDGVQQVSQLRSALGNLSTPWLLVAFFAGMQSSRPRRGAVIGLAATLCALAGFYLLSTMVENLGGHGFIGDLRIELSGNREYFEGGIVTGPIFGALGAWQKLWSSRPTARTSLLAGGLLIGEPLVMLGLGTFRHHVLSAGSGLPLIARIIPGWGLTASSSGAVWAVYAAELALGLAVILVALTIPRRRSTRRGRRTFASQ